jgi:very-short-patch-repair endonuclease
MITDMYFGASPKLFHIARKLRRKLTLTEKALWDELCDKKLNGLKFRRQHPIYRYIVDFYNHQHKIVIELDGTYHKKSKQKLYDDFRDAEMVALGLTVIRFTDDQIISDLEKVIEVILEYTQ